MPKKPPRGARRAGAATARAPEASRMAGAGETVPPSAANPAQARAPSRRPDLPHPRRDAGTALPPRPRVRALWVERNPALGAVAAGVPAERLATLEGLAGEEAAVLTEIERGLFHWPPDPATTIRLGTTERSVPVPARFRWRDPLGFLNLPTVSRLLGPVVRAARDMGMGALQAEQSAALWGDILFMQCAWRAHGRRVYYLDAATADLLLQTALPRFPATALRAPLPAFVIALPEDRFHFTVDGDAVPQAADSIHVVFTGDDDDPDRSLALLVAGRSRRGDSGDDNVLTSLVALPATRHLSDLRLRDPLNAHLEADLLKLVVGLCLYLSSEHPGIEPLPPPDRAIRALNPAKRRRQERRLAGLTHLPMLWVREPGLSDDEAAPHSRPVRTRSEGSLRSGWTLTQGFDVEGYWRQQPFGPGRQLRRNQWIKPHRRGPAFAEALRRGGPQEVPSTPRGALVQPATRRTSRGTPDETPGGAPNRPAKEP